MSSHRKSSTLSLNANRNKPLPPISIGIPTDSQPRPTVVIQHDTPTGNADASTSMFQPKTMKRRNLKKLTLGDDSGTSPLSLGGGSLSSLSSPALQTPISIFSNKSSENLELVENFGKLSMCINPDDLRPQDLLSLKPLGEGQSGVVSQVLHVPTNKLMAKKQIMFEKNIKVQNQILRELKILNEVNSPYIIKFYGAIFVDSSSSSAVSTVTPTKDKQDEQQKDVTRKQAIIPDKYSDAEGGTSLTCNGVIICMEYMDCGSLDYILKKLGQVKEVYLSKITHNVLQGLNYLYTKHKIIHRDIKPSNVLLSSKGEVKICDFGVSRELNNNSIADTFVGTSTYMSPERIQGDVYNIKGDVWSLGLMLIELCTGEFPFGKKDTPNGILDLLQRIVNEDPPSLPRNKYSKELCDFVELCLKKQQDRPTPLELLELPSGLLKKYEKEESVPMLRHLAKKLKKK